MTSFPTDSTRPARSEPTDVSFGRRNPPPITRPRRNPVTPYHSTGLTEDACTRTSTWSSSIAGVPDLAELELVDAVPLAHNRVHTPVLLRYVQCKLMV